MALLTVSERKAIFKELGLGEYNKTNIKAFQKKYMARKKDVDGVYGTNTDNTLRTVYYTKKYTKNFKPSEFKCECGGKYCCGYPSYMKPAELIHIQKIRDHYGKPITITSGLRCKTFNKKCGGSIQNSLHMSGLALDFYQQGVTDTLANRKRSIKWIKKQPNHHYTYGNGINSYGNGVSAPYMGNALHTDTYDKVKPVHPKLTESPSTGTTKPSATKPQATTVEKIIKACREQAEWMKNYKYKWQSNPTIPKSKKYGTCVTYVACVLQRIGVLKSGEYVWIDENGKVIGANSKMKVTYLKGTLASNKDKLKKGDIVIGGNGNIHAAGGSHIFVISGKWKGDNPIIFDQESADRVKKGYKPGHQWKGSFRTIARIRVK